MEKTALGRMRRFLLNVIPLLSLKSSFFLISGVAVSATPSTVLKVTHDSQATISVRGPGRLGLPGRREVYPPPGPVCLCFCPPVTAAASICRNHNIRSAPRRVLGRRTLRVSKGDNSDGSPPPPEPNSSSSAFLRFTDPVVDDRGLPLADFLISGIAAPATYVIILCALHLQTPSWLVLPAIMNGIRGSLLAPTLLHGAGLSACWVLGALAGRAYEAAAFDVSANARASGRGFGEVLLRIAKSGAFAIGVLVFCTQVDLFLEYGRYIQPGEGDTEVDLRILTAATEVTKDVVVQAAALGGWRIYRANLTVNN